MAGSLSSVKIHHDTNINMETHSVATHMLSKYQSLSYDETIKAYSF